MKAYDLSSINVLIIDDHKFSLSLVHAVLRSLRVHEIVVAEDPKKALKLSNSVSPDLIFCDYAMSPMTGLEFMRDVRGGRSHWDYRMPIVMLTSYTENTRVMQARDAGASYYLSKPFSALSVYKRIVQIIERPKPFVKVKNFIGPDRRRRREAEILTGKDRRWGSMDIAENPDLQLSQDELKVLLEEPA